MLAGMQKYATRAGPWAGVASGLWPDSSRTGIPPGRRVMPRDNAERRISNAAIIPETGTPWGARPPRASFSAPSRKTRGGRKHPNAWNQVHAQLPTAGRSRQRPGRACSPTPVIRPNQTKSNHFYADPGYSWRKAGGALRAPHFCFIRNSSFCLARGWPDKNMKLPNEPKFFGATTNHIFLIFMHLH